MLFAEIVSVESHDDGTSEVTFRYADPEEYITQMDVHTTDEVDLEENLTDEQIRALIRREGYMGINFYSCFLAEGRTWAFALPALYVPLHVLTWRRMAAIRSGRELNAILGQTSRNMLIFALLLSIGLVMG